MFRSYCVCVFGVPDGLAFWVFFFNDTATTEIYTLSLHDALPICLEHYFSVDLSFSYIKAKPLKTVFLLGYDS